MYLSLSKNKIVEKIFRDQDGQLMRATFCIYEVSGRVKARLIEVVRVEDFAENTPIQKQNSVLFISGKVSKNNFETVIGTKQKRVSPYFNSDILSFLGSKPRAPTF